MHRPFKAVPRQKAEAFFPLHQGAERLAANAAGPAGKSFFKNIDFAHTTSTLHKISGQKARTARQPGDKAAGNAPTATPKRSFAPYSTSQTNTSPAFTLISILRLTAVQTAGLSSKKIIPSIFGTSSISCLNIFVLSLTAVSLLPKGRI